MSCLFWEDTLETGAACLVGKYAVLRCLSLPPTFLVPAPKDGHIYAWGVNSHGQCGTGSSAAWHRKPTRVQLPKAEPPAATTPATIATATITAIATARPRVPVTSLFQHLPLRPKRPCRTTPWLVTWLPGHSTPWPSSMGWRLGQ